MVIVPLESSKLIESSWVDVKSVPDPGSWYAAPF
jgi:hypothetical protein